VRSTTFLFTALCTSIQLFGVTRVRTGAQENVLAASRRAAPCRTEGPRPHAPLPRGHAPQGAPQGPAPRSGLGVAPAARCACGVVPRRVGPVSPSASTGHRTRQGPSHALWGSTGPRLAALPYPRSHAFLARLIRGRHCLTVRATAALHGCRRRAASLLAPAAKQPFQPLL
jgi:hypothetical protein